MGGFFFPHSLWFYIHQDVFIQVHMHPKNPINPLGFAQTHCILFDFIIGVRLNPLKLIASNFKWDVFNQSKIPAHFLQEEDKVIH